MTPDLTVRLLSVLLCFSVTLLLFVVLSDLIVELLALLHKHVNFLGEAVTEILLFIFLHIDQLGVVLQQAESVDCGIGDARAQVRSVHVG